MSNNQNPGNPSQGRQLSRAQRPPSNAVPSMSPPGSQQVQPPMTNVQPSPAALPPNQDSTPTGPILSTVEVKGDPSPSVIGTSQSFQPQPLAGHEEFFRADVTYRPEFAVQPDGTRRFKWRMVPRPTRSVDTEASEQQICDPSSSLKHEGTALPSEEADSIAQPQGEAENTLGDVGEQGTAREIVPFNQACSEDTRPTPEQSAHPSPEPNTNILATEAATSASTTTPNEDKQEAEITPAIMDKDNDQVTQGGVDAYVGDKHHREEEGEWKKDDTDNSLHVSGPQFVMPIAEVAAMSLSEKSPALLCGIDDCEESFASKEDLHQHHYYEHADTFCDKCRISFQSNKLLMDHKATSPKHIACLECGEDFNHIELLRRHMIQFHPEKNTLICPGCFKDQTNPSLFMQHVEGGHCHTLSKQFLVRRRVMTTMIATTPNNTEKATKEARDEAIIKSFGSLEAFHRLDDGPSLERVVFEGPTADVTLSSPIPAPQESQTLQMPPPLPTAAQSYAQLRAASSTAGVYPTRSQWLSSDHEDAGIRKLTRFMWGGDPLQDVPDEYDTGCNGHAALNPFRAEFDGRQFVRHGDTRYLCPRSYCNKSYAAADALRDHMKKEMHTMWTIRCPACYKTFQDASSIIAHFESGGRKCNIRNTAWVIRIVAIASSGLLFYSHKGLNGPVFRAAVRRQIENRGE